MSAFSACVSVPDPLRDQRRALDFLEPELQKVVGLGVSAGN